jgi:hypothetical protein
VLSLRHRAVLRKLEVALRAVLEKDFCGTQDIKI